MRLTTAIWLGIFMRREADRGAFVTVIRKGAAEAGTLFILHLDADRSIDLYGPAPQSVVETGTAEKQFEKILTRADEGQVDAYLERQQQFDPDLWIVETQAGCGDIALEVISSPA